MHPSRTANAGRQTCCRKGHWDIHAWAVTPAEQRHACPSCSPFASGCMQRRQRQMQPATGSSQPQGQPATGSLQRQAQPATDFLGTCRAASSSGVASSVRPRFVKNALADFCSTRRSARPTAERRCDGSSSWGHRGCVFHSSCRDQYRASASFQAVAPGSRNIQALSGCFSSLTRKVMYKRSGMGKQYVP